MGISPEEQERILREGEARHNALLASAPSFTALFTAGRGYSRLLRLRSDDPDILATVAQGVQKSTSCDAEIAALLADTDWCSQIVGACAIGLGGANPETLAMLYSTLDCASWASPQLAAIASVTDTDFELQARRRIEARCPIDTSRLGSLEWVQRHPDAGPLSFYAHSCKLLSSLMALCEGAPWLTPLHASEDIKKMIAEDIDRGSALATNWRATFVTLRESLQNDDHSMRG